MLAKKLNKRNAISDEMPDFFTQNPAILLTSTKSGKYYTRGKVVLSPKKEIPARTVNKVQHFGISIDSPFDSKYTTINHLTGTLNPTEARSQYYLQ